MWFRIFNPTRGRRSGISSRARWLVVTTIIVSVGACNDTLETVTTLPETQATVRSTNSPEEPATTSRSPWPAPPNDSTIAVLGCSFTDSHTRGYTAISTQDQLRSGSMHYNTLRLQRWADVDGRHWRVYDDYEPVDGYSAAWFQICLFTEEPEGAVTSEYQEHLATVIEAIRTRSGDIPIYLSPSHTLDPEITCIRNGFYAPEVATALIDWAVDNFPNAHRGPETGPLTQEHLEIDMCHLSDAGETFVGQQVVDFFDRR